jgi:hydrogenase nickel incorporation protein HypA/HybF
LILFPLRPIPGGRSDKLADPNGKVQEKMHELSLIKDLMRKIEFVARSRNARKVVSVKVQLGALAHISADHFRNHFVDAARGTAAESARLDIEVLSNENDLHAMDILLSSVTLEE